MFGIVIVDALIELLASTLFSDTHSTVCKDKPHWLSNIVALPTCFSHSRMNLDRLTHQDW
jgi:hypothetical protein